MKMSQQESKSGFFLSQSHIDQDSGFSSKIGIIPTKSGWLDNLGFPNYFKFAIQEVDLFF